MRVKGSLPILLAVSIGLLAALGAGILSVSAAKQLARAQLRHRVAEEFSQLNDELANNFNPLLMLRVFFESSAQPITGPEFQRLAWPVRHGVQGLQLVGWAPRVTQAEREDFERNMRDSGLAGFEIRDRASESEVARAPDRQAHYPLLYEQASSGGAFRVIGSDLPSDPRRLSAIEKAVATNMAASTPAFPLVQSGSPIGIVAYMPVFRPGSRADLPDGVIFGVYRLAQMLDGLVREKHRLADLDAYVFDRSGGVGHRLVYWRAADGRRGPPASETAILRMPHVVAKVQLLDQTLDAIVVPVGALADSGMAWTTLLPSAIVLLLTAIIVVYMVLSSRRSQQLHAMAEDLRDKDAGLRHKAATIAHMARHDALTALPNRVFFAEALARKLGEGAPCTVLHIGLDRFKAINELHGHAIGDCVLREVAKRVRAITRSDALVARLGGDEFAVIAADVTDGHTGPTIARRIIDAINMPIEIEDRGILIGVTIGIASFPRDGSSAEALLHAAELAMDTAKQKEPGSLCRFEPGMHEDVRARLSLEADLRRAIEAGDIKPYYQPVMRLEDATLVGFEILARWQHAQRGLVMPDSFIGLAESTGLIADMTYSLLRRALADSKDWPAHLYVALNISAVHLKKPELPGEILAILHAAGTETARLEVEVTETALVSRMDVAKTSLLALQRAGVRVALDDFGTGYSSLAHLRQLPLNKIKIDRSFVSHLLEDEESRKIVAAIVGLGKSLGIAITAEGIETKDVAVSLAAMGCDFGQGYFFAKPMTAEATAKMYCFDAPPIPLRRLDVTVLERAQRRQLSGGAGR